VQPLIAEGAAALIKSNRLIRAAAIYIWYDKG
jgi:hypothetical protein